VLRCQTFEEIIKDALSKREGFIFCLHIVEKQRCALGSLLKENPCQMKNLASGLILIKAVVS